MAFTESRRISPIDFGVQYMGDLTYYSVVLTTRLIARATLEIEIMIVSAMKLGL